MEFRILHFLFEGIVVFLDCEQALEIKERPKCCKVVQSVNHRMKKLHSIFKFEFEFVIFSEV